MKKLFLIITFSLLFLFNSTPTLALENLGAFTIDFYDVVIDIDEEGAMLVEEKIIVDFSEPRHGIYREMPYKYQDDKGFKYNLRIKVLSVEDQSGKEWKYEKSKSSGNLVLKIGHPDYEISGQQTYIIKYEVKRGLRFFSDHSELYWNPIGTNWPTTIGSAASIVNLPREIDLDQEDLRCFAGYVGSDEENCTIRVVSPTSVYFESNISLRAYQGMTIAMKFPLSYIPAPSFLENLKYFLIDNWGFLLPIIVLIVMYFLWKRRGKEINLDKTIIAQYEAPDNLTPGEMGYLLKNKYKSSFVAADIINLAVKGYLKIKEDEGASLVKAKIMKIMAIIGVVVFVVVFFITISSFRESALIGVYSTLPLLVIVIIVLKIITRKQKGNFEHTLIKVKDWENSKLTQHEKALLEGLFRSKDSVKVSSLKTFYNDVGISRKKIKAKIKELGYFEKSIWNSSAIYIVASFILLFASFMLASIMQRFDVGIGGFLSAVLVFVFGVYMSKRTRKGAEALWYAKGFREYINTAERYRVKFQEKENIFEQVLPYAMVFGLADKWAKAFKDILKSPPDWYESSNPSAFTPAYLATSMNSFTTQASAATHAPSSSSSSGFSGGSSGGGFGGGGGGSW